MKRFINFGGGGSRLSSCQGFFKCCKKLKICYNSDIKHHNCNGVYMKRFAFTLAEVLITLGIIGIIAALTIPGLIAGWQKKVVVNKLKHSYSVLSNALLQASQVHGDPTEWDWGDNNSLENCKRMVHSYVTPYMNIIEETSYGQYVVIRIKNGTTFMFVLDGCTNPDACDPITISSLRIIVSSNGLIAGMSDNRRDYSRKDFVLNFYRSRNKLTFFNWGGEGSRDAIKNNSIYACNKSIAKNKRMNCGALIYYDGWEIKDDYPW